jgi:hypothetical protein
MMLQAEAVCWHVLLERRRTCQWMLGSGWSSSASAVCQLKHLMQMQFHHGPARDRHARALDPVIEAAL